MLEQMQRHWRLLLGIASWILTVLGTFLVAPAYASTGAWETFGRFVVAIIAGLLIIVFTKGGQRRHAWIWFIVCLATLVIGGSAWISYTKYIDAWTLPYGGSRVVIGERKIAAAKAYQEQNGFTQEQLIMEYAGATERIWPIAEMNARRFRLCLLYLASLAIFSVSMMTLMKGLDCITRAN